MKDLVKEWLRGLSPHITRDTITSKEQAVLDFLAFCAITSPEAITPKHLEDYQQHLSRGRYHPATIRRKLTAIRDFIRYLRSCSLLLLEPDAWITFPKTVRSLARDILSEQEVRAILSLLGTTKKHRTRAIVELFYATGIRKQELINLNLYDLNIKERTLWVRQGKGKKDRLLPVTKSAVKTVNEYIKTIRFHHARTSPALFIKRNGERLNENDIQSSLYKIRKRLKIEKRLSVHVLRHSIATHLIRRGVDIRCVQAFLGHAHLNSTEIYTRVVNTDLKKGIDRCHPRNKMRD